MVAISAMEVINWKMKNSIEREVLRIFEEEKLERTWLERRKQGCETETALGGKRSIVWADGSSESPTNLSNGEIQLPDLEDAIMETYCVVRRSCKVSRDFKKEQGADCDHAGFCRIR